MKLVFLLSLFFGAALAQFEEQQISCFHAIFKNRCCRRNPLVNPALEIRFNRQCPHHEGDPSVEGCVENTGCQYQEDLSVSKIESNSCFFAIFNNRCCRRNSLVNPDLEVKFNRGCPRRDGDESFEGCVEFTGCQYQNLPAHDEYEQALLAVAEPNPFPRTVCFNAIFRNLCCRFNPLVNHGLDVRFNRNCPRENGDTSLDGCVEFSGCQYQEEPDESVAVVDLPRKQCFTAIFKNLCCRRNPLVNHGLKVKFNRNCPRKNGDPSIDGCVEFSGCQYQE